ncbi:type I-E CRISPR-associated protein Cse2/CasB [Mangrovihabitans endophyticus]|uniref:CRISPR system Cascade subunit CasB n=1 Tax=Mangrovihabitans endophyticus TaxID=1751298 RepID=A0A8J3C585_9ACTN|nr:type I-E CRISPR-associated protein Cse2/CasB [Mangrovihabitans endophyticus]GGL20496.1 hypothetical protein GCM10012284_63890 [Mangrovihabitans endophyticus]
MTSTETPPGATTSKPPSDTPRLRPRRRREFGEHVARTVDELQRRLLHGKGSTATATMAHLRAAASRAPGADYTILDVTAVPGSLLTRPGDEPTWQEWAKHSALTLYAVHQQSLDEPMHRPGAGIGAAVSRLAAAGNSPEAVRRRFTALGSAASYDALTYHLRGIAGLLRQHRISIDYGLLADDLLTFQQPGGPDRIRALWGREFYRIARTTDHPSDDTETTGKE